MNARYFLTVCSDFRSLLLIKAIKDQFHIVVIRDILGQFHLVIIKDIQAHNILFLLGIFKVNFILLLSFRIFKVNFIFSCYYLGYSRLQFSIDPAVTHAHVYTAALVVEYI